MSVDWKSRLIEASSTRARAIGSNALAAAVDHAVKSGVGLEEVKQFAQTQPALSELAALFADGFFAGADRKAATDAVGGDARALKSTMTSPGFKVHALRADPAGALPWFQKAQLPVTPKMLLVGTGQPVTVDGERFSTRDIAELLALAA